ncbi:type I-E CRISPR-associated protein Cse1/CasA [Streptomyces sp. UNOC14_S4]|uniref:type I-E CRISPR-associated protein Cse1/CasA n=1 Tax=Streptomyces sp. UNOC14_S4 TaxID=2872340 RepID=UPI0023B1343B|nr:type I-E CRISPR-associated protein Cse1/CasA [Streptomyces sp. UNOC14_S4]MCC3768634.1 type I-E CRISPR-associated protein Cse1/CasA [Streptomyces sp. UNOC14_S4]
MSAAAADDARYPLDLRPCAPVLTHAGMTERVGLRELFLRAHEFQGLAVASPAAASALLRMLYAIAARITGLDKLGSNVDDWLDRRFELLAEHASFAPKRAGEAPGVDEYFAKCADGLMLYDPQRPFLQDARLAHECASSSGINKLVLGRPSGNNQVFFGHFTDDDPAPLPSDEAFLHLLAQLYYGASGQCTPRTVNGQRYGNTMAGPLRRVLSCHPLGRNLYESLLLGIPGPDSWPGSSSSEDDLCPWEDDRPSAVMEAPAPAAGSMSMLTARHQHAVLLKPSPDGGSAVDATITWALRENRPEVRDPYLIWDEAKDGMLYPRKADAERALWRDLDGLILQDRGDKSRGPPVFEGLTGGQLPEEVFQHLRVAAYGFDQDGQTRDRSYFTAVTPPLCTLLTSSGTQPDSLLALGVKEGREAAERAAWRLETALRSAWRAYTLPTDDDKSGRRLKKGKEKDSGPWPEAASAAYWPAAEECFWELLDSEDFTAALPSFGRIALRVFDDVTEAVASQPRGAKAREGARGLVRSLLKVRA